MKRERHYIVTYDISDQKRWRLVFRTLKSYGEWLQLSVFQCQLTLRRHTEMLESLEGIIHMIDDHVLILDLGPVHQVKPHIQSLGKGYELPSTQAAIV